MNNILLIYIVVSFFILFVISKVSYKLDLIDHPNKRKIHQFPTAYTGGLALSLIYIFSIFLYEIQVQKLNLILSMGFLIATVGLIDDKYNLNVGGKLSLQIIPIIYLIVSENLNLIQLGDYHYFKLELNSFSIPFTVMAVLFLINSFNYFDGLDGSLSFSTISTLGILLFLTNNNDAANLGLLQKRVEIFIISILIPIILFLFFNFSNFKLKKLFLGDGGSLLLGFIISFTIIYLANQKIVHPILLAYSISIFVYEFLSINFIRLKNNQNLFEAGQDHLHHILFLKTNSIFLTNCVLILINVFLFMIGYFSFVIINPITSLILFIILFIIFLNLRVKYLKN